MKNFHYFTALKWFIGVNLLCLGLPLLPTIVSLFIHFALYTKPGFSTNTSEWIWYVPYVAIPLSLVVAIYRGLKKGGGKKPSLKNSGLLFIGIRNFMISIIMLYGLITVYVFLIVFTSSDASLVGVVYIFALPVVLVLSLIVALFSIKRWLPIVIFLALTVLPFGLYQGYYIYSSRTFHQEVIAMQSHTPTAEQWQQFFDRYQNSHIVTGGSYNQLANVLHSPSIPVDILKRYAHSEDMLIRWSLAQNPSLPEAYMYEYAKGDVYLRRNLASNPNLPEEIMQQLSQDESIEVREALTKMLTEKSTLK